MDNENLIIQIAVEMQTRSRYLHLFSGNKQYRDEVMVVYCRNIKRGIINPFFFVFDIYCALKKESINFRRPSGPYEKDYDAFLIEIIKIARKWKRLTLSSQQFNVSLILESFVKEISYFPYFQPYKASFHIPGFINCENLLEQISLSVKVDSERKKVLLKDSSEFLKKNNKFFAKPRLMEQYPEFVFRHFLAGLEHAGRNKTIAVKRAQRQTTFNSLDGDMFTGFLDSSQLNIFDEDLATLYRHQVQDDINIKRGLLHTESEVLTQTTDIPSHITTEYQELYRGDFPILAHQLIQKEEILTHDLMEQKNLTVKDLKSPQKPMVIGIVFAVYLPLSEYREQIIRQKGEVPYSSSSLLKYVACMAAHDILNELLFLDLFELDIAFFFYSSKKIGPPSEQNQSIIHVQGCNIEGDWVKTYRNTKDQKLPIMLAIPESFITLFYQSSPGNFPAKYDYTEYKSLVEALDKWVNLQRQWDQTISFVLGPMDSNYLTDQRVWESCVEYDDSWPMNKDHRQFFAHQWEDKITFPFGPQTDVQAKDRVRNKLVISGGSFCCVIPLWQI